MPKARSNHACATRRTKCTSACPTGRRQRRPRPRPSLPAASQSPRRAATKAHRRCATQAREPCVADAPLRVLIVDDEAPARRRLRDLLADCAAALPIACVGEAANGREALELLHAVSADLVLTDIQMPEMGGLEFARHGLKLQQPPVVIFTTAH